MTYQKIIKVLGLPDGSVRQSSAEKNKIFFVLYLTHPHICRHTYCTNMAKSGISPKTLQYLMGHSSIEVTMNVYTHLGLVDAKREVDRLEAMKEINEKEQTGKWFRMAQSGIFFCLKSIQTENLPVNLLFLLAQICEDMLYYVYIQYQGKCFEMQRIQGKTRLYQDMKRYVRVLFICHGRICRT